MQEIKKNRIYFIDLLKILSIFCVVVYHIVMDMYIVHPMYNFSKIYSLIDRPNMHLAMLACALFIFISGATLYINDKGYRVIDFYKKRFMKILIPFYIAYIIALIIKFYNFGTFRIFGGINKLRFIYTLIGMDEYLNACNVKTFTLGVGEWFLGCIMLCYLIYPILKYLNEKYGIKMFFVMTIYYVLFNVFYDRFGFYIPSHMNFLSHIYNFYLGIFLIKGLTICDDTKKRDKYISFTLLIIPLFLYIYEKKLLIPDNIKVTIAVVIIVLATRYIENFLTGNFVIKKMIEFLSGISLYIYLLHHIVIYQVDYVLKFKKTKGIETLFIIILDFLITIMLSLFVRMLYRKIETLVNKAHKQ